MNNVSTDSPFIDLSVINEVSGRDLLGAHDVLVDNPKISPLHDPHVAGEATFVQFEQALWVDRYPKGIDHEYLAIKTDAGILDVSLMSQIVLSGPDAVYGLQHFFTNNLVNAPDGSIRYGALVGRDGTVIDDCLVYKFSSNRLWLFLNVPVAALPNELWADWRDPNLDATAADMTDSLVKIQLQGPASPQILQSVFPDIDPNAHKRFRLIEYSALGVTIGRCGFSGEDGFELFAELEQGRAIWERLKAAGATPYGISAIEYCRVEAGLICNEHEYVQGENYPQEIGLGQFLKPSVAEWLYGYPVLEDVQPRCTIWTLLFEEGLHSAEKPRPANGAAVCNLDGAEIGELCSVVFSPLHQRYLALAKIATNTVDHQSIVKTGPWRATAQTFRDQ